jgi:divalent metal cation (Fe/Co/Zn/Cd) transporter
MAVGDEQRLLRRGRRLEYATLVWNVVGVAVLAVAAWKARSVALVSFGWDSAIEIVASMVVLWQLADHTDETRERRATRMIGVAFVTLAAYIAAQTLYTVVAGRRPAPSALGIAWLTATGVAMFALASGKARTGARLGNETLSSEARVTVVDGLLALAVLLGLMLNTAFGWWWADPAAGLVVLVYGAVEGVHALRS